MVDFLTNFGTGQDNLAADEDEQHNLRLHHAIDEPREEFRFVGREMVMTRCKTFETNRELDVTRSDDVLNLEVCTGISDDLATTTEMQVRTRELGVESQLLNDAGILATCHNC